jgi:hypothetical protein
MRPPRGDRRLGVPLGEIVKRSASRASIDPIPELTATYEPTFSRQPQPARTTTGAELHNILVEIDAVLYLRQR